MDKSLICKIVVTTKAGKRTRGTGYAIARDRMITAAHVVEGAADQPHAIELYFGEHNVRYIPDKAPSICWNGKVQGCNGRPNVDVAVIECELPGKLVPGELLLAEGTIQPTEFHGCCFSTAGQTENENGYYDFSGEFHLATGETHEHSVDCPNGPVGVNDEALAAFWGGASGASLFERARDRLLAVVTHHIANHKLPRLKVVPLPFLMRDSGFCEAIGYKPIDSREWYVDSRRRLRRLAQEVLEESDVTLRFILKCNHDLSDALSAEHLAEAIFDSDAPMTYLRKCANQSKHKRKLTVAECEELRLHIYRLVEFVAPMCFGPQDLHALEPHVNRNVGDYAKVTSTESTVVTSQVACIKGVSADLNKHSDWAAFGLNCLSDSREIVAHLPPAPEAGRQAKGREKPIDAFVALLAKAIHPDQPTLPHVKAKLQSLATFEEIFFVVLFDTQPSDSYLNELHRTFPELILLVAEEMEQPSDALPTPDVSLAVDIHDLRKEFGPQNPNTETA